MIDRTMGAGLVGQSGICESQSILNEDGEKCPFCLNQSLDLLLPRSPQVFSFSLFPTTTLPHLSTGILGGHLSLTATESKLHL